MKKNILFMFVILLTTYANSQINDFICATPDNNDPEPEGVYSHSIDPAEYTDAEPIVLNIYFWQVKGPNGEYNGDFTEYKALEAVANLNINYNQFNIFFKYRGYDSFDTPNVPKRRYEDVNGNYECVDYPGEYDPDGYGIVDRCQISALWNFATINSYVVEDAINVYVPYQANFFGGAVPYYETKKSIVPLYNLNNLVLPHETGHNLGLRHTTDGWRYNDNSNDPCGYTCEHATRNPEDEVYNAHCKGDRITDTNAVPEFKREHYYELIDEGYSEAYAEANYIPYNYIEDCVYTNVLGDDCQTTLYTITHEDVINVMLPAHPCEEYVFTPGQGIYLREIIESSSVLQTVLTDVASLYEPYRGEYPAYYPHPQPWEYPLFQPGFNYRFIECSCECPAPAGWNDNFTYDKNTVISLINKDETDYSTITHPNHTAIWIKHETSGNGNEVFPQPQKCYDNWNSPPVIGGTIVKFNDDVFNTNVTITEQDSTSINNPELIDNLQPGLYNIIENYENGNTQETVILKQNN